MEQLLNEIKVAQLDGEINRILAALPEYVPTPPPRIGYNQNEELFLELDEDFVVPSLPIHHSVKVSEPEDGYIVPLRDLVTRLALRLPMAFQGLTYYFDSAEILKPCFFRLYKVEESIYLYLLRIDLSYRPFESSLIEAGTNDMTPIFKTRRLFVESEIIPLSGVTWEKGAAKAFAVRQIISNTWIGETGRGYLLHGIWMDSGLTKFFSKLILPEGLHLYPFFPLFCKYKTICASAPVLKADYRRKALPLLHRAINFVQPEMEKIQNSLKDGEFSEKMPLFAELRAKVPASWKEIFHGYAAKAYLNERDMKEFSLEIPDK
jgi:hypothetical protein